MPASLDAAVPVRSGRGWSAIGNGAVAGIALGIFVVSGRTHAGWPILVGLGLGIVCSWPPAVSRFAAVAAGSTAVATAVATVAATWLADGWWPIDDAVRIAQYGSTTQAIGRLGGILAVLLGGACVVGVVLGAGVRRGLRLVARTVRGAHAE